ncbi:MAG: DNA repair protein RadC [bacterium]
MAGKNCKKKIYEKAIKNWPQDERPREKLLRCGEHTLSDTELLAIILRTGIKGQSAVDLSRTIIQKFKTFRNMGHTNIKDWDIKGLGMAKIAQVKAAIEIGRRFGEEILKGKKVKIETSHDVAKILMNRLRDLKKEVFKVLYLDVKNQVIEIKEIEEGSVNQASPNVREILLPGLQNFSSGIICIHNHPSGDSSPSEEDRQFTRNVKDACGSLGLNFLDHIIIGDNKYFSFADKGLI